MLAEGVQCTTYTNSLCTTLSEYVKMLSLSVYCMSEVVKIRVNVYEIIGREEHGGPCWWMGRRMNSENQDLELVVFILINFIFHVPFIRAKYHNNKSCNNSVCNCK